MRVGNYKKYGLMFCVRDFIFSRFDTIDLITELSTCVIIGIYSILIRYTL